MDETMKVRVAALLPLRLVVHSPGPFGIIFAASPDPHSTLSGSHERLYRFARLHNAAYVFSFPLDFYFNIQPISRFLSNISCFLLIGETLR